MFYKDAWLACPAVIQEITGCSERTARRWLKNPEVMAPAALRLLQLHSKRQLLTEPFDGFLCHSGMLWTPENVGWSAAQLRAIPFRLQQIQELERRLRASKTRY